MVDSSQSSGFILRQAGITGTTITLTGFTIGVTYSFKVKARSAFGYSDYSNVVSQLAALTPTQPSAPTTAVSGLNVIISWTAPDPQGWAILGYRIYIGQSDSVTYTIDTTNCDGTTSVSILTDARCTVPISSLIVWPYSLPWGSHVYAKVIAYNGNGDSLTSAVGNGAIILTYPDAPLNLAETVLARTASTITFTWSAGVANGGTPVLDYSITYD